MRHKKSFWGWVGGLMTNLCHLAPNEKMQRGIFRRRDMKCKDIFVVTIWPQCVVFVLVFDELGMQIMKFFHWHQLKKARPKEMIFYLVIITKLGRLYKNMFYYLLYKRIYLSTFMKSSWKNSNKLLQQWKQDILKWGQQFLDQSNCSTKNV